MYEEKDESFYVGMSKTRDDRMIVFTSGKGGGGICVLGGGGDDRMIGFTSGKGGGGVCVLGGGGMTA